MHSIEIDTRMSSSRGGGEPLHGDQDINRPGLQDYLYASGALSPSDEVVEQVKRQYLSAPSSSTTMAAPSSSTTMMGGIFGPQSGGSLQIGGSLSSSTRSPTAGVEGGAQQPVVTALISRDQQIARLLTRVGADAIAKTNPLFGQDGTLNLEELLKNAGGAAGATAEGSRPVSDQALQVHEDIIREEDELDLQQRLANLELANFQALNRVHFPTQAHPNYDPLSGSRRKQENFAEEEVSGDPRQEQGAGVVSHETLLQISRLLELDRQGSGQGRGDSFSGGADHPGGQHVLIAGGEPGGPPTTTGNQANSPALAEVYNDAQRQLLQTLTKNQVKMARLVKHSPRGRPGVGASTSRSPVQQGRGGQQGRGPGLGHASLHQSLQEQTRGGRQQISPRSPPRSFLALDQSAILNGDSVILYSDSAPEDTNGYNTSRSKSNMNVTNVFSSSISSAGPRYTPQVANTYLGTTGDYTLKERLQNVILGGFPQQTKTNQTREHQVSQMGQSHTVRSSRFLSESISLLDEGGGGGQAFAGDHGVAHLAAGSPPSVDSTPRDQALATGQHLATTSSTSRLEVPVPQQGGATHAQTAAHAQMPTTRTSTISENGSAGFAELATRSLTQSKEKVDALIASSIASSRGERGGTTPAGGPLSRSVNTSKRSIGGGFAATTTSPHQPSPHMLLRSVPLMPAGVASTSVDKGRQLQAHHVSTTRRSLPAGVGLSMTSAPPTAIDETALHLQEDGGGLGTSPRGSFARVVASGGVPGAVRSSHREGGCLEWRREGGGGRFVQEQHQQARVGQLHVEPRSPGIADSNDLLADTAAEHEQDPLLEKTRAFLEQQTSNQRILVQAQLTQDTLHAQQISAYLTKVQESLTAEKVKTSELTQSVWSLKQEKEELEREVRDWKAKDVERVHAKYGAWKREDFRAIEKEMLELGKMKEEKEKVSYWYCREVFMERERKFQDGGKWRRRRTWKWSRRIFDTLTLCLWRPWFLLCSWAGRG